MGKKLAADDDCIVLDVKTGSGSFMKTLEKSRELAEWMVAIGKKAGKRMRALITDMGTPLGYAIGNSLEVVEAIHTLQGKGPQDLTELCVALSAHILVLAEKGDYAQCEEMVRGAIADGTGLQTFADMVEAQGGNKDWILHPENFPVAKYTHTVVAQECGYITGVDAEGYGVASLLLGAGRNTKEDVIDPTAGIYLLAKTGDYVEKGAPIATLYSGRVDRFAVAEERLLKATQMGKTAPAEIPLILDVVE
jgi:pyrimidine-nucleoside phosphorylase